MKDTHAVIINAALRVAYYQKDIRNITMNDIAKEAGISRQAIYAKHFSSVDDIFREVFMTIDNEIYKQFEQSLRKKDKDTSVFEIVAHDLFPIIYKHKTWLKILYTTTLNINFKAFLFERYVTLYKKYCHTDITIEDSEISLVIPITEYVMGLISSWLSHDVPMSPTNFAEYFLKIIDTSPLKLVCK